MYQLRCLEELSVIVLTVYHFSFWWRFYSNPFRHATSEVLSNFFPHWLWLGRRLRAWESPFTDKIYYRFPAGIPFLSTFYPPYLATAYLSSFLSKDTAFRVYSVLILIHSLLGSIFAFIMFRQFSHPLVALFGSLSLTYSAYMIRPFTPCEAFTMAWLPLVLTPAGWVGLGMALLGGYFPIIVTASPIFILNPSCLSGLFIALPQLIPFLFYFPRSVRSDFKHDPNWGRMPIKRFFIRLCFPENGVHYPEYSFGTGLSIILTVIHPSFWWIFVIISIIGSRGHLMIDRIPARWLYLLSFSLVMASVFALNAHYSHDLIIGLVIGQGFLLWRNRDIYPHFPFCQWWRRPSEFEWSGPGWPNNTGYMNEEHHHDYEGGFSLRVRNG